MLQDVAKIGRRFEIVEVPNGYALNMLIPKGLAEAATPQNVKRLSAQNEKTAAADATALANLAEAVTALEGRTVPVAVELNEQGHMFAALKPAAVVEALKTEGVLINEADITIEEPIKEAGVHAVTLGTGEQAATLKIEVVSA